MLIRRLLLAAIGLALLVPSSGCGCRRCCNSTGSFAPPPAPCCPAPPPGVLPPPGP